jgi:hypothetical protein
MRRRLIMEYSLEDTGPTRQRSFAGFVCCCVSGALPACLAGFLTLAVALCTSASAQNPKERILSFKSHITVNPGGTMLVTETIRVSTIGDQIKHGIYRDFPTRYKDRRGNSYVVGFDVKDMRRDNAPEDYRTKTCPTVYGCTSAKGLFPLAGEYTYTLTYQTDRQLGFFRDHTNFTGTSPATVGSFPSMQPRRLFCQRGCRETRSPSTATPDPRVQKIRTSWDVNEEEAFPLSPRGAWAMRVTIVAGWPKGFVTNRRLKEAMVLVWDI